MLQAVHIARYRGIRELAATGFGRVNLIVGKNDCGKTAFMEALQLTDEAENAAHFLLFDQRDRLGRTTQSHDFERFWRPMFFGLDATAGFAISVERDDGARKTVDVRQGTASEATIPPDHDDDVRIGHGDTRTDIEVVKAPTWALDIQRIGYDRVQTHQQVIATRTRLKLPRLLRNYGSAWISSGATIRENDLKYVSTLLQRGQDRILVELLREVEPRVSGIQLLAPSGEIVELFVRLDHGPPMLPMTLMGEGDRGVSRRRCYRCDRYPSPYDRGDVLSRKPRECARHIVADRGRSTRNWQELLVRRVAATGTAERGGACLSTIRARELEGAVRLYRACRPGWRY